MKTSWKETLEVKMKHQVIMQCALDAGIMLSTAHGQGKHKLIPVSDVATLKKFASQIVHELLGDDYLECVNYDAYYNECRMSDGTNPTCHPNAWAEGLKK